MFLESKVDPAMVVKTALQARQEEGICDRSKFGDCKDISQATVRILNQNGIHSKLTGGIFSANPAEEEDYDHSWVIVENYILDPTIDQFFSALDVDLHTKTPGIYFSHPQWDGNWLRSRYK